MSTANVNNNQPITCHHSLGAIFGSKPGKEPQGRNFSSYSWIIRPPILLQPGLNRYSKVSARSHADEGSRTINLIDNSISIKHICFNRTCQYLLIFICRGACICGSILCGYIYMYTTHNEKLGVVSGLISVVRFRHLSTMHT